VIEAEVLALAERCSNIGRWGADDQLGTLNLIDDEKRLAALRSVRAGDVVTLGAVVPVGRSRQAHPSAQATWRRDAISAFEAVTLDVHGYEVTHLDALGHVFLAERTWGDRPTASVLGTTGLGFGSVLPAAGRAIVTRGVLLDVAATRGVDWLTPADGIGVADLELAEARARTRVGVGDAIFVRAGHGLRAAAEGEAHDEEAPHEGVLPDVVEWLWQRGVAVYSGDCIEQRPTSYERITMPLHQIGLAKMGLCILDCPDLETLAAACRRHGRNDFLLIVAPLKIPGGTASAVNPLAIF
jgi:kynurenine formamidase